MAWVESHQELANHPKTRRLCRELGISKAQAVGHLHLLWWWALDYAQDGDLSDFTTSEIADGCEWEGDPVEFVMALQEVRFLDQQSIHDWDQYGGKYFKRQEQARERQRRHRTAQPRQIEENNALVTRDMSVSHAGVTRLEEKRGEERTGEDSPHTPRRGEYTVAFEAFWTKYPRVVNSSKKKAAVSWGRLKPEVQALAMAGLDKYLASDGWRRGFAPHATTYLNGALWESDPPPARMNGHAAPVDQAELEAVKARTRALGYQGVIEEIPRP